MRRALVVTLLLALCGCSWILDRAQCGLKCPANSACGPDPGGGGVFWTASMCKCKYGRTKGDNWQPTDGDPCPPKPKAPPVTIQGSVTRTEIVPK